jgi:hypothetical protein
MFMTHSGGGGWGVWGGGVWGVGGVGGVGGGGVWAVWECGVTPYVRHSPDCTCCDFGHLRFIDRCDHFSRKVSCLIFPSDQLSCCMQCLSYAWMDYM